MNGAELIDLHRGGEDSAADLKRGDVWSHGLAREFVALLNLGDDGSIRGTTRYRLEEWAVGPCQSKIEPSMIPTRPWMREAEPGQDMLAIGVAVGLDKPYAHIHDSRRTHYIHVGSTSREASCEELKRVYRVSGRLRDYLTCFFVGEAQAEDDQSDWETLYRQRSFNLPPASCRCPGWRLDGSAVRTFCPRRHLDGALAR